MRDRLDWLLATGLAAVALLLRLRYLGAAPYGDEAFHFTMARTLGLVPLHIQDQALTEPFHIGGWIIGRPLFALLHWPAAQVGFEAFRVWSMGVSSAVAVLAYALVRKVGGTRPWAFVAAAPLAAAPSIVLWGSRVFPDASSTLLLLACLLALPNRARTAAAVLAASLWAKESALGAAAGIVLWSFLAARRDPTLRPTYVALCVGLAAGLVPLLVSILVGAPLPGWAVATSGVDLLVRLAWSLPVLVLLPFTLRAGPPQPVALAASAQVAFYAAYAFLYKHEVQAWHLLLPVALSLVAVSTWCSSAWQRLATNSTQRQRAARTGLAVVAVVILLPVVVSTAALPAGPTASQSVYGMTWQSHFESQRAALVEGHQLGESAEAFEGFRARDAYVVDVAWYNWDHPFRGANSTVGIGTGHLAPDEVPLDLVAATVEQSDVTVLQDYGQPVAAAIRSTYGDCAVFDNGRYVLLAATPCSGRAERLRDAFANATATSA